MDSERLRATLVATSALRTRSAQAVGWRKLFSAHRAIKLTITGLSLIDALLIASDEFGRDAGRDQLLAALPTLNGDLNPIAAPLALAKIELNGAWREIQRNQLSQMSDFPAILPVSTGGYVVVSRREGQQHFVIRAAGYSGVCPLDALSAQTEPRCLDVQTNSAARTVAKRSEPAVSSPIFNLWIRSILSAELRQACINSVSCVSVLVLGLFPIFMSFVTPLAMMAFDSRLVLIAWVATTSVLMKLLHAWRQKNDWLLVPELCANLRGLFLRSYVGTTGYELINITDYVQRATHNLLSSCRLIVCDIPVLLISTLVTTLLFAKSHSSSSWIIFSPSLVVAGYCSLIALVQRQRASDLLRLVQALQPALETTVERLRGDLALDGATVVSENESGTILTKVNLRIRAGERVGILGETGSGKTTLLKTFAGQIPLEEGRRYIDGQPHTRNCDAIQRDQIYCVLPEVPLVRGTILDNVLMGRKQPMPGMMDWIARTCNLHSLLNRSKNGWQQLLGASPDISTGERQAIALARAFVGDPVVLLLDEPTMAMDAKAEQAFLNAITNDSVRRTIVIASNRQSVLKYMDRLIWLENGTIIADKPANEMLQSLMQVHSKQSACSVA
jgi:ABC-type bacteriocin/lantibiotic exporter with double-glycine peptidase domain